MSDDSPAEDTEADDSEDDADRGDPFDAFDGYRDREGDPFDSLGDDPASDADGPTDGRDPQRDESGAADGNDDGSTPDPAAGSDPDPFEYMGDRGPQTGGQGAGGDAESPDGPGDDPLADVTVSDGDPFESASSAFERSGVEGIDPDEVWDRLTGEPEGGAGAETGDDGEFPADEDDIDEVSKHGYCEGCEYFSAPPDVACGHEGTDILEFVDVDTVRVSNCPVVEERRELEEDA